MTSWCRTLSHLGMWDGACRWARKETPSGKNKQLWNQPNLDGNPNDRLCDLHLDELKKKISGVGTCTSVEETLPRTHHSQLPDSTVVILQLFKSWIMDSNAKSFLPRDRCANSTPEGQGAARLCKLILPSFAYLYKYSWSAWVSVLGFSFGVVVTSQHFPN